MSLLDGFLPEDPALRTQIGSTIQGLGMSLLQGDSRQPFANVAQNMAVAQRSSSGGMNRAALKQILMEAGYDEARAETYSADPKVAELALQRAKTKDQAAHGLAIGRALGGDFSPAATPQMTPAAPSGPAAGASLNGGAGLPPPDGSGAEIQSKFVDSLKAGGLTNPFGLAAVAAYGQHESRYDPGNVNRTWSDPSESGQAGTSGGILSWRDGRLAKMQAATRGAEDPVAAQAQFTLNENPALTAALQQAKSPEEANALMADAWKFAGYNRPGGGEYAARLATTRSYADRFAGAGAQPPVQVADASGRGPVMPVTAAPLPAPSVRIAENEAQVQSAEAQMEAQQRLGLPPRAPAPTMAQADLPVESAAPVAVPGRPERARHARDGVRAARSRRDRSHAAGP